MSQSRALETALPWSGTVRQPRRRSRLLGVLRVLLPVVALVLVGLVLAWPQIMRDSGGIGVPALVPGDGDQPDLLRMDSPRYVGQTSSDRPYEITARAASFDPLRTAIVHLDRPVADIALAEDDVHLTAARGVYDRDGERLLLDGGIEVVTSSGYRFVTPSARVNLAQGQVRGWQQIEGEGPTGTLSANRFEIQDAGDVLRFDGRVRVTVQPPAPDDAATARSEGGTSS